MKKGFTLIELLVVVLIIGILSAIALPQYTKAVEKSRAAEAMQILKSLRDAQAVCILEHGAGSDACGWGNEGSRGIGEFFDNISIDIPGEIDASAGLDGDGIKTKNFLYGIITYNDNFAEICAERIAGEYSICTSAEETSGVLYNRFVCWANGTYCAGLGFKKSGDYWVM